MGFKCGIVGLPNVGKSTLFNALTNSSKAQAANFPFCTIDPNIGLVPVPDERLDNLVNISKSKKKIYTTISFVDIAGLVKGASKGEGLGNKFLSHIREVDAIIHMIRCFDSDDIQNVNPDVNPVRDLEIIETEMKLADLESIQKRLDKKNRKNIEENQTKILERAMSFINNDKNLDQLDDEFEKKDIKICGLLSTKPKLYVCNVDEDSIAKCIQLGAQDYLPKPLNGTILLAKVLSSLERKFLRQRERELVNTLHIQATTDQLTGIFNRRMIFESLENSFSDLEKGKIDDFSVIMLDIDFFKKVNDTYGHAGGDEVLKEMSKSLKKLCKKPNIIGRIGGEEFLAVIYDIGDDKIEDFCKLIRNSIHDISVNFEGKTIKITSSGGVARTNESRNISDLVNRADKRLYKAKKNGRDIFILN